MDRRTEPLRLRRPIQRMDLDPFQITCSETSTSRVGDMTNVTRHVSKGIRNKTINLHRVGSQNNPIHFHRITTALGMQVSPEAVYKDQMRYDHAVQLGDGLVQIHTMKR